MIPAIEKPKKTYTVKSRNDLLRNALIVKHMEYVTIIYFCNKRRNKNSLCLCVIFLLFMFGNCFITKIKWKLNIRVVNVEIFTTLVKFSLLQLVRWHGSLIGMYWDLRIPSCSHLTGKRGAHRLVDGRVGRDLSPCLTAQPFSKQNVALHALGDEMLEGVTGQVMWFLSVPSV